MKNIGIIAGSFKPMHRGHWHLIKKAANENDVVQLFISTSDRVRRGEFPVYGSAQKKMWDMVSHRLPQNVEMVLGGNPIRNAYDVLGKASEAQERNHWSIYMDKADGQARFTVADRKKYMPWLHEQKLIDVVALERAGVLNISGTQMRTYLQHDDDEKFLAGLPEEFSDSLKLEIWNTFKAAGHSC